jgi:hypothetical protein
MSSLSFDIKTSKDFFKILLEDYKEFDGNRTSSRHALHCAIIAWHMIEWVHKEFESQLSEDLFKKKIVQQCPSFEIMRDIADGTKHSQLGRKNLLVKETELHRGVFSEVFSREFDTSHLYVILSDGAKIYFEDEIKKVVLFWTEYLKLKPDDMGEVVTPNQ